MSLEERHWLNPFAEYYNKYQSKTSNLRSSAMLGYELFPNLELKSSFGYNLLISNKQLNTKNSQKPEDRAFYENLAFYSNRNLMTLIVEPQLSYNKKINSSRLDVLCGRYYSAKSR